MDFKVALPLTPFALVVQQASRVLRDGVAISYCQRSRVLQFYADIPGVNPLQLANGQHELSLWWIPEDRDVEPFLRYFARINGYVCFREADAPLGPTFRFIQDRRYACSLN